MKKKLSLLMFLSIFGIISGCAATGPRSEIERYPRFNQDPALGLIIVEGTPAAKIRFYDKNGELVDEWTEKGTNPALTYNRRTKVRLYKYRLAPGRYKVVIEPFYYTSVLTSRRLVELRTRTKTVTVDEDPRDSYDRKYTKRHWGWVLRIDTGRIPRSHYQSPRINISGIGPFGPLIEWIRTKLNR